MSKLTETAAMVHELSVTAMEEASRFGQRTADIEHMFLALVLSEHTAGLLLRGMGITLTSARQAVTDVHSSRLALLGIDAKLPQSDRITFHETGGEHDWSDRAAGILSISASPETGDFTATLLQNLLLEPSGLISDLLNRLDTTPAAVSGRLSTVVPGLGEHARVPRAAEDSLIGSRSFFVPAPTEDVWALLVAPSRMCEWGPCYGVVEYPEGDTDVFPGEAWIAHAATHSPDGTSLNVRPEVKRERVELLTRHERSSIAWRFTYPDAPALNSRRVEISLAPASGGTELAVKIAWERNPILKPRRVSRAILRPMHRYAIWNQLTHIGGSVSRVFR